ncbi:MAG: DUF6489 family protein [Proteobacteria bacterium]|nr:DUF6489 family protein [Pseudomonadota bacterium]
MKITVDLDITPEELRRFLGLPNVEGLQDEMLKMAQKQITESGQGVFNDLITGAVQPMYAYQQWLQRMMTGERKEAATPASQSEEPKSKKKT